MRSRRPPARTRSRSGSISFKDHPRLAGVLRLVAAKAGWDRPLPNGRFRGVAVAESCAPAASPNSRPRVGSSVRGRHPPTLVIYDGGRLFALDNRCPHMGFPLDRGSVEDGILTCHWHHARFDVASGCTFDLWADDVLTCQVELRDGELWIKPSFGHADPSGYWRGRLDHGLAHNLGLVIAKAVRGQLLAGVSSREILRPAALFAVVRCLPPIRRRSARPFRQPHCAAAAAGRRAIRSLSPVGTAGLH